MIAVTFHCKYYKWNSELRNSKQIKVRELIHKGSPKNEIYRTGRTLKLNLKNIIYLCRVGVRLQKL